MSEILEYRIGKYSIFYSEGNELFVDCMEKCFYEKNDVGICWSWYWLNDSPQIMRAEVKDGYIALTDGVIVRTAIISEEIRKSGFLDVSKLQIAYIDKMLVFNKEALSTCYNEVKQKQKGLACKYNISNSKETVLALIYNDFDHFSDFSFLSDIVDIESFNDFAKEILLELSNKNGYRELRIQNYIYRLINIERYLLKKIDCCFVSIDNINPLTSEYFTVLSRQGVSVAISRGAFFNGWLTDSVCIFQWVEHLVLNTWETYSQDQDRWVSIIHKRFLELKQNKYLIRHNSKPHLKNQIIDYRELTNFIERNCNQLSLALDDSDLLHPVLDIYKYFVPSDKKNRTNAKNAYSFLTIGELRNMSDLLNMIMINYIAIFTKNNVILRVYAKGLFVRLFLWIHISLMRRLGNDCERKRISNQEMINLVSDKQNILAVCRTRNLNSSLVFLAASLNSVCIVPAVGNLSSIGSFFEYPVYSPFSLRQIYSCIKLSTNTNIESHIVEKEKQYKNMVERRLLKILQI